jgi:DNA-binding NtrC family response regulator
VGELVAKETAGSGPMVFAAAASDKGSTLRKVERLICQSLPEPRHKIAVLDDNHEQVADLCEYFNLEGFLAEGFVSIASLEKALMSRLHDAYVLDWLIGKTPVIEVIAKIRSIDLDVPIVILTGQVKEGNLSASDAENAVSQYDAHLFEKPSSMQSIAARLGRLLHERKHSL